VQDGILLSGNVHPHTSARLLRHLLDTTFVDNAVPITLNHDPPTTPLELVQVIVDLETGPATFAVPVHTVPSTAVPENLNLPLKDAR
jgi:hypothetical protein